MVELISILSIGCHNIMVTDILSSGNLIDQNTKIIHASTTTNWAVRIRTFFQPLPEAEVNQVNIFFINIMEITS